MSNKAPRLRHLLVPVLVLVSTLAILTVVSGSATAQVCNDKYPLFITEVRILGDGLHEDSHITEPVTDEDPDESAAFLHEGDGLQFQLKIENTLSEVCGAAGTVDGLSLERAYLPDPTNVPDDRNFTSVSGMGCTEIPAGQDCMTEPFGLPHYSREIAPGNEEQLVRFLVSDDDGDYVAGAERTLVVGSLPNMLPASIEPADDANLETTYDDETTASINVTITNEGEYPNWNPNGGDQYWSQSKGPGGTGANSAADVQDDNFRCKGFGENEGDDVENAVCSYRRGAILDTSIYWEIYPKDEPDNIKDRGAELPSFDDDETQDTHDKDDALGSGDTETFKFDAFNLEHLAGTYTLLAELDRDLDGSDEVWIPDSDPEDNADTTEVEIHGVDLELTEIDLAIEGFNGLCTTPSDPCDPEDHLIEIDPLFENVGEIGSQRSWNASVSLIVGDGDEEVATDIMNSDLRVAKDVPDPGDEETIFDSRTTVKPAGTGGAHILHIRLDHPQISYGPQASGVNEDFGRIAETDEGLDCPEGYDDPDSPTWNDDATRDGSLAPSLDGATNTYCITLYYDAEGPSIVDASIEIDGEEHDPYEEAPAILEGAEATFRTTVEASAGVDRVNATFTSPEDDQGDSTVTEVPMEQSASQDDVWEVDHSFEGDLGEYTFEVAAWDTLNQPNEPAEPAPFIVGEWPKNITTALGTDQLNGEETVLGPDAPQFEGTVSEPDNWFNLTTNVTDTGHDVQPGDVHFRVWDPDDEQRVDKTRMAPITVCWNQDQEQNVWGEECDPDNPDSPFSGTIGADSKGAEWTSWYVDTRDDETWNHPNLTLPWVGEFNVEVIVKDGFGRTNHANWTAQLQDIGPAELTNETLTPTTLVPGDEISASGEASDPLRVERVFLNVIKPSGETAEGNLTITEVHDAETQSGVWEATFTAGQAESLFDQAGTYEVEMIADDFGTNPNSTDMGTLTIEAGDPPEILSLFTDPSEEAEAGINLTWNADIAATTAIQPPQLTVTKGDGSTETLTLTQDEDTGLWTVTIKPEPLQPEETWTYELEVRDFADQVDTATGEILVLQNTAPHATNWQPNVQTDDGRPWVNDTPTLKVDLVDANGINQSSIHLRIDGTTIWEDGSGDAQVEEIPQTCPGCYRITHTPSDSLEDGDTLTLEVKASEESDEELESDWHTRQFHVDATDPAADLNLAPALTVDGSTVIGLSTQIEASVEDAQSGPGDLRITVESLAGSTAATRQVETADGERTFQLNEFEDAFRGHGEYRIEVEPWDGVGNKGDTHQLRLLYDAAPPQIRIEPQLDQPASFIAVDITDISEVLEVQVVFTPDGQPEESIELERDGDLWIGEIVDPETGDPYPEDTEIEYRIEASDYWGNSGSTDARTFIAGATPPTLTIDSPEDGATIQGTIDVLWTATDEDVPDEDLNVSFWYSLPDGDPREIPGATDLANTGQFELDTTLLPNGRLELQAIAFDGATFGSDSIAITVRNLGDVFEEPELVDADTRDDRVVIQPGQETDFQVRINQNVLQAWANVTKDGDTVASYELQDEGDGVWSASFTAPEEEGDYDVDLAAMAQDGRIHADSAYGFSVQSDDKSFLPEWTILTVLFAGAVAVGAFGLTRRWG